MFYLDILLKAEENTLSTTELTTATPFTTKQDTTKVPSSTSTEDLENLTDSSSTYSKSG